MQKIISLYMCITNIGVLIGRGVRGTEPPIPSTPRTRTQKPLGKWIFKRKTTQK